MSIPPYRPELASLTQAPPSSDEWLHEIKADGWRLGCAIEGSTGRARLISRHGRSWSEAFPTVREAAARLPLRAALLDGELAVLMPSGLTDFQALQNRTSLPPGARIVFYAFDLHHLDGKDTTMLPLEERKRLLEEVLAPAADSGVLLYTPHFVGDGPNVFAKACPLGVEGIVSKRRSASHTAGRSRNWLKSKCLRSEPFVIGGFTASDDAVGALLVGAYDPHDALRFAGSVGTGKGFTREFLQELMVQLSSIRAEQSPFADFDRAEIRSQWNRQRALPVHWVQPIVVADVAYVEITHGGQLRHPSFQRLRSDLSGQRPKRIH